MSGKKSKRFAIIIAAAVSAVLLAIAGWLLFNRQYVIDQIAVWAYRPNDSVLFIEERLDFTDKGTFYFYASHPEVSAAETFNQDCPRIEVSNPILGCYYLGRIFIYDIDNPQLDGIEEVTAAHEMLHAAWDRMSPAEQKQIGTLLRAEYGRSQDGELKTRMDYYARTEPGQFENELHSILGTEVSSLGDELEEYYRQFFRDRQKVTTLHRQYESVFNQLRDQSSALYDQLISLSDQIQSESDSYNSSVATLSNDIESFNQRALSGQFNSQGQFTSERSMLVARTRQLEAVRDSINGKITEYDQLYTQYRTLAVQIEALHNSLDSMKILQPTPTI